jgi:hypothetical protein
MAVIYTISDHARERMEQRNIPPPDLLHLRPAGRAKRKRIRAQCAANGVKAEHVYMTNDKYVFVCIASDVGCYIVVTAFEFLKN